MVLALKQLSPWAAPPCYPRPTLPGGCSAPLARLVGCSDLMMKAPLVSRSFRSLLKRLSRLIMNL